MATPPDFTAGQVLTAAQMNQIGLWLVKSQDFSGSDPLDLTGIFTSDFRNYKLLMSLRGSASSVLIMHLLSGTNTLVNGANYFRYGFAYSTAGATTNLHIGAQTSYSLLSHAASSTDYMPIEMTIFNPNINTIRPHWIVNTFQATDGQIGVLQGLYNVAAAYTGLRFDATSGTITGNVRVYGFND